MIETGLDLDEDYYVNDDRWAGHYLLLTGYDDNSEIFIAHDSLLGPDQQVNYSDIEKHWIAFNHVYMLVYLPNQEPLLQEILGTNWDPDSNREQALNDSTNYLQENPEDAFEWFNLGSNLVYFNRYEEAVQAYDKAREIGIPQRMLRYQFGPFFAYYNAKRFDDLWTIVNYALRITYNSEEALYWKGWALFQQDDYYGAITAFRESRLNNLYNPAAGKALEELGAEP